MMEPTESTSGPAEPEETQTFISAAEKRQTSLTAASDDALDILKEVKLTESVASEETDSREKPGQDRDKDRRKDGDKDRQQDGDKDGQQDGDKDGQTDGQTVSPPAAESSRADSKWVVGAQCRAVWSEDGRVYPATVVSVDGQRCRVRFNGYGNQQDVEVSALRSAEGAPQTHGTNSQSRDRVCLPSPCQEWRPGSRCRAVYSEDSLVYPAVVLWVKGQRCRIRFDDYDNEEEQDVSGLLSPDELHGPSRTSAAKGGSWRSSISASNLDWKRRREERGGGGGGGGGVGERQPAEKGGAEQANESKVETENEEQKKRGNQQRDAAEAPTNHSLPFFPPFPPPPQTGAGGPVSFIPPPPPLWTFVGRDPGGSAPVDASFSMLMLWYMCGFHTGSYMAQQLFKSNSKD